MANYAERVAALEAKFEDERRRLNNEIAILGLIPTDLQHFEMMVHPYKLYDRIGSLHIQHQRYESLRKGPEPTAADVLKFAAAFPPIDTAIYRDGCVGVRSLVDAQDARDKAQARMAEGQDTSATYAPIAPFWLSYEAASHSQTMTIQWLSQTPIGILEIRMSFPIYGEMARKIAHVEIRRVGQRHGQYGDSRISSAVLVPTDACRVVGDAKAEILSFGLSEDRTQPGGRTLYYASHNGECGSITLADLFSAAGIEV